jgi:hypothetical protein
VEIFDILEQTVKLENDQWSGRPQPLMMMALNFASTMTALQIDGIN